MLMEIKNITCENTSQLFAKEYDKANSNTITFYEKFCENGSNIMRICEEQIIW